MDANNKREKGNGKVVKESAKKKERVEQGRTKGE